MRDARSAFRPLQRLALLAAPALALLAGACGDSDEARVAEQRFAITANVERWRELVEKRFKKQHVTWALNIIQCESGGNPNAYNASSGASGLFQHLQRYWAGRAAAAGFAGYSVFHPEANIAASAYLLYAAGPGQWSCKHSPFEEPGYQPRFYDNGVPVQRCTPHCEGNTMVDASCGKGDCAAYGSTCVNDALGLRCVFGSCPAQGKAKACLDEHKIVDCDDGKIGEPGDCSAYGAYCSTAGASTARCVSVYCVASAKDAPRAHETCLPDGRIAPCSADGALGESRRCPAGESCIVEGDSARCGLPNGGATEAPAPEDALEVGTGPDAPAGVRGEPQVGGTLEGAGCAVGGATPDAALGLSLLALLRARRGRRRARRG